MPDVRDDVMLDIDNIEMAAEYAEAIDVLMDWKGDWQPLVREIAKASPGTLVRAHQVIKDRQKIAARDRAAEAEADLDETAANLISLVDKTLSGNCGRKVEAVKAIRVATGWGLKESLDYLNEVALPALERRKSAARDSGGKW